MDDDISIYTVRTHNRMNQLKFIEMIYRWRSIGEDDGAKLQFLCILALLHYEYIQLKDEKE